MGTIHCLPKEVIEKIAAGEVVERPASVVKELVENAIDAGARSITIDITAGGTVRIAVADDGCGMDAEDLGRCVLRHATSKIAVEGDLFRISTMGFRGEALAAIGAVSRLSILSRQKRQDAVEGGRIDVEGGGVEGPIVAGCACGTQVEVRELFFNVPARRKFMRSAAVEAGHIIDVVGALALSHPSIRFDLTADKARRLSLPACGEDGSSAWAMERVVAVLGDKFRGRLIPIEEKGPDIAIRGWIAEGGRSGGKDAHFFLNLRPVRDRILMHALSQAFEAREIAGSGPAAVLWIEIDPAQVDVNVHPAKREVRFAKGNAVHDFVRDAVRKVLSKAVVSVSSRGALDNSPETTWRSPVASAILRYEEQRLADSVAGFDFGGKHSSAAQQVLPRADEPARTLRPLGQLDLSYILCEGKEGSLILIDQHAAHERLAFDTLRAQYADRHVHVQRLLIPQRVELGAKESAAILEHLDALLAAGFEVEPFGGKSLVVKAVPEILGDVAVDALFGKLAQEFDELGGSAETDAAVERIFAVVACHRQVRAGDRLSPAEVEALVADVERHDVKTCPHGRPAIVCIERSEIDKWFKR